MREQLAKLSRGHDLAKAFNYILKRWASFTLFLEDGRVCLSNNAAERGLRGIALGRKSWLFCGSDRGGRRAAAMYSLIITAKMNGVDPQAWLADVLVRIAAHPAHRLNELLPWNWTPASAISARASMTTHINKVHHVTTITRSRRTSVKMKIGCETLPMEWRSRTALSGSMVLAKTVSKRSLTSASTASSSSFKCTEKIPSCLSAGRQNNPTDPRPTPDAYDMAPGQTLLLRRPAAPSASASSPP